PDAVAVVVEEAEKSGVAGARARGQSGNRGRRLTPDARLLTAGLVDERAVHHEGVRRGVQGIAEFATSGSPRVGSGAAEDGEVALEDARLLVLFHGVVEADGAVGEDEREAPRDVGAGLAGHELPGEIAVRGFPTGANEVVVRAKVCQDGEGAVHMKR